MTRIREVLFILLDWLNYNKKKLRLTINAANLVVFDLDNTLADTWPCLVKGGYSRKAYASAKPIRGVINKLKEYESKGYKILILTARKMELFRVTRDWLKENNISSECIIVPSARHKLKYLRLLVSKYASVIYYDDLSYNQERGQEKLYSDIIRAVQELNLQYHGLSEIKKLRDEEIN
ncbi:MAG: hypothetical protein GC180_09310 [Bacteroidetes bacterium]|nr:hypothetical protein [Bacteroidota bacterium]